MHAPRGDSCRRVRVILVGAPGSGKGTQSAVLADHLGVPHISSGELLRAEADSGSELGRRIREYTSRGELVPDDLVFAALSKVLDQTVEGGGFVLDGFPRTLAQARRLDAAAAPAQSAVDLAVHLDLPDDIAYERIARRARGGRTDDAADVVHRRLRVFHEETEPLLDYYRERGILASIDADQPADAVTAAILDAVAARQPPQ